VESVPLLWAFKVPRVLRACRFVSGGDGFQGDATGDAGLKGGAVPLWMRTLLLP
jgi:hypothetical protein